MSAVTELQRKLQRKPTLVFVLEEAETLKDIPGLLEWLDRRSVEETLWHSLRRCRNPKHIVAALLTLDIDRWDRICSLFGVSTSVTVLPWPDHSAILDETERVRQQVLADLVLCKQLWQLCGAEAKADVELVA